MIMNTDLTSQCLKSPSAMSEILLMFGQPFHDRGQNFHDTVEESVKTIENGESLKVINNENYTEVLSNQKNGSELLNENTEIKDICFQRIKGFGITEAGLNPQLISENKSPEILKNTHPIQNTIGKIPALDNWLNRDIDDQIDLNIAKFIKTVITREPVNDSEKLPEIPLEKLSHDSDIGLFVKKSIQSFEPPANSLNLSIQKGISAENIETAKYPSVLNDNGLSEKPLNAAKGPIEFSIQSEQNNNPNNTNFVPEQKHKQSLTSKDNQNISGHFRLVNQEILQCVSKNASIRQNQFPIIKQLTSMIIQSDQAGQNTVRFKINTDSYGEIEIRFNRSEDENSGTIIVKTASAQALIQKLIPAVNGNLIAKDIFLSSLNVEVDQSGQDQARFQDRHGTKTKYMLRINNQNEIIQDQKIHDFGYNSIEIVA